MMRKTLVFMLPMAGAWLVASQWKEINRYLKIKQMSAGDGHPESVPAGGSLGYDQPGAGPQVKEISSNNMALGC